MAKKQVLYMPTAQLVLDRKNYRLPPHLDLEDQILLAVYLENHYDLDEIGRSMAAVGFRAEEPLIIVQEDGQNVTVEGNRRLATIRFLTEEPYRDALQTAHRREFWHELSVEATENGLAKDWDLDEVPVVEYESRKEVEGSLGFRHVSGIAEWSAESKARYIADLVREGRTFEETARLIGSRSDYIRRQFVAHKALEEGRREGVDVTRAARKFGVYYRSLSNPKNREFIGLMDWSEADIDPDRHVITNGYENFSIFLSLVFGTDHEPPVITDSRKLDDLGRVLGEDESRDILISERDFDSALRVLGGDRSSFFADLRGALDRLRRANGSAFEFVGDLDLTDLARRCLDTVERVLAQLEQTGEVVEVVEE